MTAAVERRYRHQRP